MKNFRSKFEADGSIRRSSELLAENRLDEAIDELKRLLEDFDRFPDLHNRLGLAYSLKGFFSEACDEFRMAIHLNPGYIEAHLNLSIIYNEMGLVEEGRREYVSAAKQERIHLGLSSSLRRRLSSLHSSMGEEYEKLGLFIEAAREYRNALKYNPEFLDVRNRMAMIFCQLRDYNNAIKELQTILKVNPGYYEAKVNLGYAWYLSGKTKRAKKIWKDCTSEAPADERLRVYMKLLDCNITENRKS